MRTLLHAAFLAGLLIPATGAAGSAFAADLDYTYGPPPPPVAVLPPPPPPCGIYRPCFRPYPRLGYLGPHPYRYNYVRRGYAYGYPPHREGYGYDYDRVPYERATRHLDHYGYDPVRPDPDVRRSYERREHVERYEEGRRPYADPLGHERFERRHEERFGERRDDEHIEHERGPGFRGERDPYERG